MLGGNDPGQPPDAQVVPYQLNQAAPSTPSDPVILGAAGPADQPQASAAAACTEYTIKPGDTLGSVAARFGTTVSAVVRDNAIANPNWVYPGQKLCVKPGLVP